MLNSSRPLLLSLHLTLLLGLSPVFAGSPEDAISIIDAAELTGGVVVHLGGEDGGIHCGFATERLHRRPWTG